MRTIRVGVAILALTMIVLSIGGCNSEGIPKAIDAQYEIMSEQTIIDMPIYTNDYRIEDGVLYIENGYYEYAGGSRFSPIYRLNKGDIILTQFTIRGRGNE